MEQIKKRLRLKRILSLPLVAFTSLVILNGCATSTPPPNVPICIQLSAVTGWCTFTVSNTEFYIDDLHPYEGKTWRQWQGQMALMPPKSWSEIKNWILAICEQENTCQQNKPTILKRLDYLESLLYRRTQ